MKITLTEKQKQFLANNKIFSTTKAAQVGLNRSLLRKLPNLLSLGAFPNRNASGKNQVENLWTSDARLVKLVKKAKKFTGEVTTEARALKAQIEAIVSEKFGFENTKNTEDDNGTSETRAGETAEGGTSE
jgi:hypothetical protein